MTKVKKKKKKKKKMMMMMTRMTTTAKSKNTKTSTRIGKVRREYIYAKTRTSAISPSAVWRTSY